MYVPYTGQGSPIVIEEVPEVEVNSSDVLVQVPPSGQVYYGQEVPPLRQNPQTASVQGNETPYYAQEVPSLSQAASVQGKEKSTSECYKKNNGLCLPFIIYAIFSAIIILGFFLSNRSSNETIIYAFLMLLWIFVVGVLIWWLCRIGETFWAWIVLLLPLVIQIMWVVLTWIF